MSIHVLNDHQEELFEKLLLNDFAAQLCTLRSLSICVAHIHFDHDGILVKKFVNALKRDGWIVSSHDLYFPDYGDFVASGCKIIIGVHSSTSSSMHRYGM